MLKPKTFVELGTYKGDSYCAFCQAVDMLGLDTACYAVNTWENAFNILEELHAYHDPLYGQFSEFIQNRFDDALNHFSNKSIDILHIDGYHTYEASRHDFEVWLPKMSEVGVILFHDVSVINKESGAWRLWKYLKKSYPNFEFKYGNGIGIIAVGTKLPEEVLNFFETDKKNAFLISDFFYNINKKNMYENQISILKYEIKMKDGVIGKKDSQIASLETTLSSIQNSLTWRTLMKYDRFIGKRLGLVRNRLYSQIKRRNYHNPELEGISKDKMDFEKDHLVNINNKLEKYELIAADITNNCNLRCTFCFNDFSKQKTSFMSETTYEKILSLLTLVDDGRFYISCLYEPTIHPQFIQFLEKIPKNLRKKVFFTTNLTTEISDEVIERLSHIDIHHINISIDSFNPIVFERLRKGAKFDRFIENLERLVYTFSRSCDAPSLHYMTVVLKPNFDEIPYIVEKCSKHYLAKMHEARFIYSNSHLNPANFDIEWKKKNLIQNEAWTELQKYAEKCPFNFMIIPPPSNYFKNDKQPYSCSTKCSIPETFPLGLTINSNGIVSLLGYNDIYFDINKLEKPYEFFKNCIGDFQSLPKKNMWIETIN
ncbi:MAG: class I SAM-dependent methyltransferase [Candidatus Methanoperedenaceae archaeon]|nr:class I SAM-dependent methyltransferase [Candidatus Methanoperedenaceae archaeon]